MTDDYISESCKPKSDQINADDLIGGSIDVTIVSVGKGTTEQPIVVGISGGHQPYKPSKSMRRVLLSLFSSDPKEWIGKQLRLFCNADIKFGGLRVGGIQISHASIEAKVVLLLTIARGKRIEFVIEPMPIVAKVDPTILERYGKALAAVKGAKTIEALDKIQARIDADLYDLLDADQKSEIHQASLKRSEDLRA